MMPPPSIDLPSGYDVNIAWLSSPQGTVLALTLGKGPRPEVLAQRGFGDVALVHDSAVMSALESMIAEVSPKLDARRRADNAARGIHP